MAVKGKKVVRGKIKDSVETKEKSCLYCTATTTTCYLFKELHFIIQREENTFQLGMSPQQYYCKKKIEYF